MSLLVKATEFERMLTKTVAPSKIREYLVDNEYLSDVIFRLADGEELRAHKMFLLTSGPIFHKLFSDHQEDVIDLNMEWITKPTMLEICRFIYTDNLNLNDANMIEIWSVALKLEMKYLLEKTIDFICKTLNEKNVFKILLMNLKHNDLRLNMKCFEFIKNNHKKCLETEEFLQLPLESLKIMFQICKLPSKLAKEAALKWENNNSHEDIEELVLLLSLNEGPEAAEEKSDDSDSDESTISHASKVDSTKKKKNRGRNDPSRGRNDKRAEGGAASGGRNQNGRGRTQPGGQQRPRNVPNVYRFLNPPFPNQQFPNQQFPNQPFLNQQFPNQPFPNQQFPNRSYHKPKKQRKGLQHFLLHGHVIRKSFKFANLEIGILSKDLIIKEFYFYQDLSNTDKEFEIWISELIDNTLVHCYHEKVSVEAGKINGVFKYYFPRKSTILKANHKYWIRIEFQQDKVRETFERSMEDQFSDSDRIALIREQTLEETAQIIKVIAFEDA